MPYRFLSIWSLALKIRHATSRSDMDPNGLLPYSPISQHYRQRFGEKVYKIPVSVAEDCPNRRGLKGMQTCIFCDEWGSAANKDSHKLDLSEQISTIKSHLKTKYHAKKFLVYFQAYTNTFLKLQTLKQNYETALNDPEVVGIVIGTRPDCLSKAVLDLWKELETKTTVYVEFGVQSFFDDQLEFIRRGHTAQDSIDALFKVKVQTGVTMGIHLMFGLPGETDEHVIATAKLCNLLPIDDVKLHNLHVLTKTPLADLYHAGEFQPIEFEPYAHRVMLFLQHLKPDVYVHRLGAVASRWDELVAPEWTRHKMAIFQNIVTYMRRHGATQGQLWSAPASPSVQNRHDLPPMLASLSF